MWTKLLEQQTHRRICASCIYTASITKTCFPLADIFIIFPFCHQAVLSSKPEGDFKVNNLRRQSESLCELEDMEEGRKQELQRSVRETEEQWRMALQTAEQALSKAETKVLLDKDFSAFKTQNENVQSWIRDQELNLQSLSGCIQVEEKPQIAQVSLKRLWISVLLLWWGLFVEHLLSACFSRVEAKY